MEDSNATTRRRPRKDGSGHAGGPGPHLRAAREALGLSGAEVARRLGVSPTTLNQWERDERAPPYDVLEPWGLVVGRSVQVVISETGSRMDEPFSPELRDLMRAALDPRLTPDDCVTLAAQMRAYVAARASRSDG